MKTKLFETGAGFISTFGYTGNLRFVLREVDGLKRIPAIQVLQQEFFEKTDHWYETRWEDVPVIKEDTTVPLTNKVNEK